MNPFVFFLLPIRANQEDLEPKEAEVLQVSEAWQGRKEHQAIEVSDNPLIVKKSSSGVLTPGLFD